ncbi:MAG: hypothetical protein HXY39_09670 [Chloroflexi bacterium]|nr:hypothetical protein [Chloroflexota bacterium]
MANGAEIWIQPPMPLAQLFDDGHAATLERSVRTTATVLGYGGEMHIDGAAGFHAHRLARRPYR